MRLNCRQHFTVAAATMILCSAALADGVTMRKGTDIPLVFDQALSSKTARAGDRVAMHVSEDIQVDGKTVIPEGAKVTAVISSVSKRKHYGVNAKIRIVFNPIETEHGIAIPIEPKAKGKQLSGSRTDQAALATGGGALVLGPVGLVGGYFVVGKEVQVKVGDRIVTEVTQDTAIGRR